MSILEDHLSRMKILTWSCEGLSLQDLLSDNRGTQHPTGECQLLLSRGGTTAELEVCKVYLR